MHVLNRMTEAYALSSSSVSYGATVVGQKARVINPEAASK